MDALHFEYIPIFEPDDLYLRAHGHGNDERFARLFRDTWEQLPPDVRETLVEAWSSVIFRNEHVPIISLVERDYIDLVSPTAFGGCCLCESGWSADGEPWFANWSLWFWSAYVDRLPDRHVRTLIAHELAHGYLIATDDLSHRIDGEVAEIEMCRVVNEWAVTENSQPLFNLDALDDWTFENCRDLDEIAFGLTAPSGSIGIELNSNFGPH